MDILEVWKDYYTERFKEGEKFEGTGHKEQSDREDEDKQANNIKRKRHLGKQSQEKLEEMSIQKQG